MDLEKLQELEHRIGINFKNRDLLLEALTHRSYLNEEPNWHLNHNERLEFLGDAVLELIVTEHLFKKYNDPEGTLTSWRAALVNSSMLSEISKKIDLNEYVLLSYGEKKDAGRARQYILANALEALIGAVYLDNGYEETKKLIERLILPEFPRIVEQKLYKDAKSSFQEEAQEKIGATPTYKVLDQWGPDHSRTFKVGVYLNEELIGIGFGPSKQEAQQKAAEDALHKKEWK
ncbi:MAG: putative ribonuclease III [Parcubacteria group bacterium Gr01-1014_2]|nr:MAG: putative ribonuclease III [Parcubacteria group bacterium Gr01-1014_2]